MQEFSEEETLESRELHERLRKVFQARHKKDWAKIINSIKVSKKVRKFLGAIAPTLPQHEVLRQAGGLFKVLARIYSFQVKYRLNIRKIKPKTPEEEKLAKQKQRELEEEAEKLAKEYISEKFKSQLPKNISLIETESNQLSNQLFFSNVKTNEKSMQEFAKLDYEKLFPFAKPYDLSDIVLEIEKTKPNSLFNACQVLPKYDWIDVFQSLLHLNNQNKITLKQASRTQDIEILYEKQVLEAEEP